MDQAGMLSRPRKKETKKRRGPRGARPVDRGGLGGKGKAGADAPRPRFKRTKDALRARSA